MTETPVSRPELIPEAFVRAWMARDARALAALFVSDADFVNVVGIWWEDRAAIERAHAYGLRVIFPDSVLTLGRVKVRMLGQGAAVVQARMRLTGQTPVAGGPPPGPRTTILTFVCEKGPDGWLCVAAQNTDIVPGAETHVAGEGGLVARDYRGEG